MTSNKKVSKNGMRTGKNEKNKVKKHKKDNIILIKSPKLTAFCS